MMIFVVLLQSIQQHYRLMRSNAYAENWLKLHSEIFHLILVYQVNQHQSAVIEEPISEEYCINQSKTAANYFKILLPRLGRNNNNRSTINIIAFNQKPIRSLSDALQCSHWSTPSTNQKFKFHWIDENQFYALLYITLIKGYHLTWIKWVIIYE